MELFRACQDAIDLEKMYNKGIKFGNGIRVPAQGRGGLTPYKYDRVARRIF